MKIIHILIALILISSCRQKKDDKKFGTEKNATNDISLLNILERKKNFAQSRLKLEPIKNLNDNIVRIWEFPGGGGGFVGLYEVNINKKKIIQSRCLSQYFSQKELEREGLNLSELEFVNEIKDEKLILEISKFSDENSFLKIESSMKYYEGKPGCRSVYLIEYKKDEFIKTFEIDSNIKECNIEKAKTIKHLYSIIEKMSEKYGF